MQKAQMQDQAECLKNCPIDNTFKIIGKKFTIHIIRNMSMMHHKRFNQFLNSVEGINPKTLSARLREMEGSDLIKRKVYQETPVRVEYYLTEKGKSLQPILDQMATFSMKYFPKKIFKDGKERTFKQVWGRPAAVLR